VIKKYQIRMGRIENYEITQTTSAAFIAYKKEVERRKEQRERAKAEFHIFADREKRRRAKDGKLRGKNVCFSHPLEMELSLSKRLLSAAFAQGAFLTYRAEECDIYVCFENEAGPRLKSAQNAGARIFTPEDFEAYLQ
jgi:NAD-dependent DNA ligase